jgi:two-component system, sensor histidine kinase and response regulator
MRSSLLGTAGGPEQTKDRTAELARQINDAVERGSAESLLAQGGFPEFAHLVLGALVGFLLWDHVPHAPLAGWGAILGAATVYRGVARRRAFRREASRAAALRAVRPPVAVLALVWGVGTALVAPRIPFGELALVLVVVAGLTAGATSSLVADRTTFLLFTAGILAPVPIGVLLNGTDRPHLVAVILILFFAAAMSRVHLGAHRALRGHLQATALLAISEEDADRERSHLDALFRDAPVAIVVVEADGRIRGVNPRFEGLFGYPAMEASGKILNDLVVPLSERPKARRLDARALEGETVVVEVERRRKDGSVIPVRCSAARVEGLDQVLVMYEDITDRRRAEEALSRLAAIVEASHDAVIGQTLDGNIITWNSAAERMFGYTYAEAHGKAMAILVPPDLRAEPGEILSRVQRGDVVRNLETTRIRKGGGRVAVSLSVSLTRDAAGRITGFSTVARDIRPEIEAREALQQARDGAERAARTRSAFLANMSHEIRTPMNAILGLTELLLDTALAPEQRRTVELVRDSAESLLNILNDVLDFSKIEAEHLELESIPFDLPALVDSTARLLAVRARGRRLELACDVRGDVPPMVRGDPTRLRQILTNLISNAIKFTPKGEIVVSVAQERRAGETAWVRFAVRDTGVGIPREKRESIFQEFEQADVSTTRQYGGTGLGLAIARRLVRLMGGELAVDSEEGRGSEFSFTASFPVEPRASTLPAGVALLDGGRVLVVDDNATNRRIVGDILAAVGAHIDEAEDAARAYDAMRRAATDGRPYQLAVVDAQMPGRDGFDLAADVRQDPATRDTRMLVVATVGQRGDAQRCRDLGIRGYLTKPVARAELLEAVAAVLGSTAEAGPALVTRHLIEETRRRLRILLAEDNPVNQEVAATMLRRRGHQVEIVSDGQAAVEEVARGQHDVVLMDVQMPVLDGIAATARIRATPKGRDLPVIAVTAHALTGEREKCLAAGMSGYVAKPFQAHELFAAVEGWAPPPSTTAAGPSSPEAPTADPVDVEGFRTDLEEAGAGTAFAGILKTFVDNAPLQLEALRVAGEGDDTHRIERAAHAYKSAAGTIRARRLASVLFDAEAAARRGEIREAKAIFPRIEAEHGEVLKFLKKELKRKR